MEERREKRIPVVTMMLYTRMMGGVGAMAGCFAMSECDRSSKILS